MIQKKRRKSSKKSRRKQKKSKMKTNTTYHPKIFHHTTCKRRSAINKRTYGNTNFVDELANKKFGEITRIFTSLPEGDVNRMLNDTNDFKNFQEQVMNEMNLICNAEVDSERNNSMTSSMLNWFENLPKTPQNVVNIDVNISDLDNLLKTLISLYCILSVSHDFLDCKLVLKLSSTPNEHTDQTNLYVKVLFSCLFVNLRRFDKKIVVHMPHNFNYRDFFLLEQKPFHIVYDSPTRLI